MRPARPHAKRLALFIAAVLVTGLASTASALPRPGGARSATAAAVTYPASKADFVPAAQGSQVLRQPDGTTFAVQLTPATQGGLFETRNGYSVARDDDGVWRYVTGRSKEGTPTLSSTAVGPDTKAPAGVAPHAGRKATRVSSKEAQARASIQRQLQISSRNAQMAAAAAGTPRLFKVPAILLATWWDTDKGQTSPQFQPGTDDPAYFKKLLDGFGGNPQGSVTQFYFESSFGQFLVQIDVYGPYVSNRSREDRCYYGGIEATPIMDGDLDPADSVLGVGGGGALGMAVEVTSDPLAQAQVNWADYDNDGDGKVDFTMIIHSGADMASTGDPCNTWSHALQATLGVGDVVDDTLGLPHGTTRLGLPTKNGVVIDRVLTMPEFSSPGHPLTIGVAAHEMAHSLGEPDYYDTSYQSNGLGDFDVMAGGSYLGNPSGSNPSLFNPASRVFQGWVTPTVVQGDLRHYTLKPRSLKPSPDYTVAKADPNLLLVPTYEIAVGETDKLDHTWSETDVYGLAKNPKTGKYIVEGYYIENVSRTVVAPPMDPRNSRGAMFDRKQHGSGLMTWHFDYWRQSNVYFGSNDAQSDPNRYQMDVMEFDQNDNTQELQRNYTRGQASDYLIGAATGITSGTRKTPPGYVASTGDPQKPIDLSGNTPPAGSSEQAFTVDDNPNNGTMTVTAGSDNPLGDCKLHLVTPGGDETPELDAAGAGADETAIVTDPAPGEWKAVVSDFAACLGWSGRVVFTGPGSFTTTGAADTWSNWSAAPTGWAFTNVSPKTANGLDSANDAGGTENVTLDVVNLKSRRDVSPGFVTGAANAVDGRGGLSVGVANPMIVPVFSNGSQAASGVKVEVREGSASGPLVASKTVNLAGYSRKDVAFTYQPRTEGVVKLVTVVDPANTVAETIEDNNVQLTELWAAPAGGRVLVVDDDNTLVGERAIFGALASLGVPYAVAKEHPTAAEMKKYAAVVWEAPVDRYEGQLNVDDREQLRTYLNGGGKLFMTSNRIFDAVGVGQSRTTPQSTTEGVEFGSHYLGSRLPNSTYVMIQEQPATVTGTGLFAGMTWKIAPQNARPFDGLAGLAQAGEGGLGTVITPYGTAKGIATIDKVTSVAVQPADDQPFLGISVDGDAAHKHFKTVTLGYNIAQNMNADDTVKVLRKVLTHFGVPLGTYTPSSAQPIVYHATIRDQVVGRATPITAVVLGGAADAPVTLFYRRHGQGAFYRQAMTPGAERGVFNGTIPGNAVTPDGVDYYVKAGTASTYDPVDASAGALYHAIGVQLPELASAIPVLKPGSGSGGGGSNGSGSGSIPTTGLPESVAVVALLLLLTAAGVRVSRRRTLEE